MLDPELARPARRSRLVRGARLRPLLLAVMLSVVCLLASNAVNSRPVLADHGAYLYANSGVTGPWGGPLWRCESSQPHIVIYAPDVLGASYAKENGQSQLVWWTSRIWWVGSDGVYHHTHVDGQTSDAGWYWAWVRPGDSHGGLIAYPERGSTGGAAGALAWSDVNGVTQTANPFTRTYSPDNPSGLTFMVEWIFYWASNNEQPYDGWLSQVVDFGDGYGGRYSACKLG